MPCMAIWDHFFIENHDKVSLGRAVSIRWHVYKRGQGIGREEQPQANESRISLPPLWREQPAHPRLQYRPLPTWALSLSGTENLGSSTGYNNERDCKIMIAFSVALSNINIVFTVFTALSWALCFYSCIRLENLQKFLLSLGEKEFDQDQAKFWHNVYLCHKFADPS